MPVHSLHLRQQIKDKATLKQKPLSVSSLEKEGRKVGENTVNVKHLLLALLRAAYLFAGIDGGAGRRGGGANRGAGSRSRGADRVDLSGHVVDLPGEDGQVLGQVLTDPTHTGK